MPDPGLDRELGPLGDAAEQLLAQSDHLSRVANITRGQVRRLEEAGVATLTALAGSEPGATAAPGLRAGASSGSGPGRLQLESAGYPQPLWQHRPPVPEEPRRGLALLPPPSDGDVFFDMEGFPYAARRAGVPLRRV